MGVVLYYLESIIDLYQFAKGLEKDFETRRIAQKAFIQSLAFSGIVEQKFKCNDCTDNPFKLVICLNEDIPAKDIPGYLWYQLYFDFENGQEFQLSVSEQIFHAVHVKDVALKQSGYLQLEINKSIYPFNSQNIDMGFED